MTTFTSEVKSLMLYFLLAMVIVLAVNSFLQSIQLRDQAIQIKELQNAILSNQEILKQNKNYLGNLSEDSNGEAININ